MHLHSNFSDFSDGERSMEEMTIEAIKLGLKQIVFTEHVRRSTEWVDKYVAEIKRIKKKYPQIKIYSGIEAKVIDLKGNIDAKKEFFKKVDLVNGVFHRIPKGEEEYLSQEEILLDKRRAFELWYQAMMKLLENENVKIIGHPGVILKRYKIKFPNWAKEKIAKKTKRFNKIFEINKKFGVPDREFLKILKKNKVKFSYGSDSHSIEEFKKYH